MQSQTFALTDGLQLLKKFAHNLPQAPSFVRAALLCTTNDTGSGAVVGDEIDAATVYNTNLTQNLVQFGASPTEVIASVPSTYGADCTVLWRAAGPSTLTSLNNFSLKLYWE